MTVFISHSSRDGDSVTNLVDNLQAANESVWLDKKLSGGQAWWDEILSQIRSCTVFVFALSNNSRTSKPCQAELAYAKALGLPILPVQIGDTDRFLIDPLFTNVIDYRTPDPQSSIRLVTSLRAKAAEHTDLPAQLPDPPPVPYEYLQRLGAAIESPEPLPHTEQSRIIMELRSSLGHEAEPSVVNDIRHLLRDLRRRPDATFTTVQEVDGLLAETEQPQPLAVDAPGQTLPTSSPGFPQATPPAQPTQPLSQFTPPAGPSSQPSMPAWNSPPPGPPGQPSMPAWNAPPPPPPGANRGKWVAIGVGAVAVAAIAGVLIWLAVRPDSSKSTASSSSSSSSSSSRSSSPSSTTSRTTTQSSSPTGAESRLRGLLPEGYSSDACEAGDLPAPGALARLNCGANTLTGGPTGASYVIFDGQTSLDGMFNNMVNYKGMTAVNCPGVGPGPTTWHRDSTPDVVEGQVICGHLTDGDLNVVIWTENAKLFLGEADGTDLVALHDWWANHT